MDTPTSEYQNGIGVSPMLFKLQNLAMQRVRPSWDLFLINIETIVRDQSKIIDVETTVKNVLHDCQTLVQYIESYVGIGSNIYHKVTPLICFYFSHYKNIPQGYLRDKLPKGTDERIAIVQIVVNKLKEIPLISNTISVKLFEEGLETGWPQIQLLDDLYQVGIDNFRKVLLISHIPLDFDLYTRFTEFTLLESYTGNLKNVKQFGKKVFNNEIVPFNKYTHLLFGDKWYLKSPLSLKDKRNVLSCAEREHWSILSDRDILAKLVNLLPNLVNWFVTPDI